MIDSIELARALYGQHIQWLLDHTNHRVVTLLVRTNCAGTLLGDIKAHFTVDQTLFKLSNGFRQSDGLFIRGPQQIIGQTGCCLRAYAWETRKLIYEPGDRFSNNCHETDLFLSP